MIFIGERIEPIFKKGERDPFIDFLKGFAIICVVITHNVPNQFLDLILFPLWGEQAVPIFLLIQAYHGFNKLSQNQTTFFAVFKKDTLLKLYRRILFPFFILLIIQISILLVLNILNVYKYDFSDILLSGGIGPGSYYIWIYLQFFFLIPLFKPLLEKLNLTASLIVFIGISTLFEVICSVTDISNVWYRVLFFRYFFILWLAFYISNFKFKLNFVTILFSIISIMFIIVENYFNYNFEPLIFSSLWKGFHWPAYFYIVFILIPVLKLVFSKIVNSRLSSLSTLIERFGLYSYEIFLLQMFVFSFFTGETVKSILLKVGVNNSIITWSIFIFFSTFMCIYPVLVYKKHIKKIYNV